MAENLATPPSPGAGLYQGHVALSSRDSETEPASESDRIDVPPEKRILRYIDRHEKEFKEKLHVLTESVKILAKDHARSIWYLKKACMESAASSQTYSQARPPPKAPAPPIEESVRVAAQQGDEATEPPLVNGTSQQLVSSTNFQDMAHRALELPSQTALQPTTFGLHPNGTHGQVGQHARAEEPSTEEPSTGEPNIEEPIIEEPNIEEPNTEEHNTEEHNTEEHNIEEHNIEEHNIEEHNTEEPNTAEHEKSDVDDIHDDNASSYSTDGDDFSRDINHEESPTPDETSRTAAAEAQPTATPQQAEVQDRQEPASQPGKSSQPAKDGSRRWKEEEENFMIDVIHDLMKEEDLGPVKSTMWQRAAAIFKTRGYDRTYQQMMAKWSFSTRHKCEARGLDWASTVMAKMPHMARKRNASSGDARDGDFNSTSDGQSNAKRVKLKSRKVLDAHVLGSAQTPSSVNSHTQESRLTLNDKVKTRKPKKKSRRSSDAQSELSLEEGFTTEFDSVPIISGNNLRPRFIWARASSDIVQVDWSPDSKYFVAASNSIFDPATNFSDNRPANLIHGSLPSKTLRELPEHRIAGNVDAGEPKYVYQTVSAVRFAPTGQRVYSAGFDNKVRVWDVEDEAIIHCKTEIQYSQRLEVMDVAGEQSALFATGTVGGIRSIRVFFADSDLDARPREIKPLRETGRKSFPFSPTCLRFGHSRSRDWLIAGFGSDDDDGFGAGCTAVWKFREASCEQLYFPQGDTFVFDCAWSPSGEIFAIGSASDALSRADAAEHSVVRLYAANQPNSIARYSCHAKDINDVTIDYGLVTASCTDGSTYVWDQRQPQKPLHRLTHGRPVARLPSGADRELEDVGVRYVEWSHNSGQLYTGSSDGILKYWDTRRSPADVLVGDLADTGREILCGRLSPDHSSLLLGDEEGRLHLLSESNGPFPEEHFQFRVAERWDHD